MPFQFKLTRQSARAMDLKIDSASTPEGSGTCVALSSCIFSAAVSARSPALLAACWACREIAVGNGCHGCNRVFLRVFCMLRVSEECVAESGGFSSAAVFG